MKAPSALAQVGGAMLATLALVQAISFGVVLATPTPAAPMMSVAEVAALIRDPGAAESKRLMRKSDDEPPSGERAALIEATLARTLALPPDDVRATWLDESAAPAPEPPPQVMLKRSRPIGSVTVLVPPGAFALSPDDANAFVTAARFSAFIAAVRQPDGQWVVVQPREGFWTGWRLRLLAAFAISAALLAPLAWFVSRRLTRPLRRLAEQAHSLDLAGAAAPVSSGPSEVRAAAAAIEDMQARLAAQAADRTRMLAAMAHDLRTPLTGLRVRAEEAPPAVRTRMIDDIARMEAMIAEVLAYARHGTRSSDMEPLDMDELARSVIEDASERGHRFALTSSGEGGALVRGDLNALRRALTNLVDNAIAYAGGGRLRVVVEEDEVLIVVEDSGPGIAPAERSRLTQPFERGEASRNRSTGGAGLGLSVVRDIARQHGGELTLTDRSGGGLVASIRLPKGRVG
ncbi:MAG TPA: HAMP domain-containing sensor histidine kinase [Allosphingosinicella sp.]|jgi:signal transduction histidine kinase